MASIGTQTLNFLGLYHPPYSTGQRITNFMFLDDLTDHLTEWSHLSKHLYWWGLYHPYR